MQTSRASVLKGLEQAVILWGEMALFPYHHFAQNKRKYLKWNGPVSQRKVVVLGSFYLLEPGNITPTVHTGDDRQEVVIPCLVLTRESSSQELEA